MVFKVINIFFKSIYFFSNIIKIFISRLLNEGYFEREFSILFLKFLFFILNYFIIEIFCIFM